MTNEQLAIFLYELKQNINNTLYKMNMEDTEAGAEFAFIAEKLNEYIKTLIGKEIMGIPDMNCPKYNKGLLK